MKTIIVAFRSVFKKGRNNVIKLVSMGVGLAIGLVLIAKVYYEQTYDDFFPNADRIYQIGEFYNMNGELGNHPRVSGGVAPGFMDEIPEVEVGTRFTNIGDYAGGGETFFTEDKKKHEGKFFFADTLLFDLLKLPVLVGDPKIILGQPRQAMVSRKIARQLGGIEAAVGKTIVMNSYPSKPITIAGVFEDLPLNSHLDYNILVAISTVPEFWGYDGSNGWMGNDRYFGYVRLHEGATVEGIKQSILDVENRHHEKEAFKNAGFELNYTLTPILDVHKGTEGAKRMASLLSMLAFALLFTAMMNYVLIVISSLVVRSKEMAVNKCYGASSGNIYGKMLAETFVDMIISLSIAVLIIAFFRGTIEELLGSSPEVMLNWRSGILLVSVCAVILLVSGFIPGYMFSRIPIAAAFRRYRESKRLWKLGLLFLQITAACFLVTLLVIIALQYNHMLKDNPGYEYEQLSYASFKGVNGDDRQRLVDEVSRMPEIASVSSCTILPFTKHSGNNVSVPGDDRDLFNMADAYFVGSGYLPLMGIKTVEGSSFNEAAEDAKQVMVNRNFAARIMETAGWTDGVVGKQINISEHGLHTICGVYENYRMGYIGSEENRPSAMFYTSSPANILLFKYHKLTPEAIENLRRTIERMLPDKDIPVYAYSSEMIGKYSESRRFRDSVLIGGIATLIITLAGLLAYTKDEINRRRKEIAIRKINGATLSNILRMFMNDISRIALPAIFIGAGASAYVANSWQAQFSEKTSLSPLLFLACSLGVLAVILSVVVVNCYQAANENPSLSIKSE